MQISQLFCKFLYYLALIGRLHYKYISTSILDNLSLFSWGQPILWKGVHETFSLWK